MCDFNSAYQTQNKGLNCFSQRLSSGLTVAFLNWYLTTNLHLPIQVSLAVSVSQRRGARDTS